MRPVRIIAAVVFAILTLLTVPAWAAPAAPATLQVSPSSVAAGHSVTVSGSVGPDSAGSECASGVTLLSRAFVHTQDFAGVPAVGAGRVALTVHLLAPNGRAVQVTRDLAGFWTQHYPALRRQLSRRYPRHAWPEDGATAKPPPPLPPRRPR